MLLFLKIFIHLIFVQRAQVLRVHVLLLQFSPRINEENEALHWLWLSEVFWQSFYTLFENTIVTVCHVSIYIINTFVYRLLITCPLKQIIIYLPWAASSGSAVALSLYETVPSLHYCSCTLIHMSVMTQHTHTDKYIQSYIKKKLSFIVSLNVDLFVYWSHFNCPTWL